MAKLTKNYVAEHRTDIQTYESFGRALLDIALKGAEEKLQKQGANSVTLDDVSIDITPVETTEGVFCVEVCVEVLGAKICKHVP